MKIISTELEGLSIVEPIVYTDSRGYFIESFRKEWFPSLDFVQENESFSKQNVLRGLHYQKSPFAQTKLVRCVMGEILDVVVDLRKNSTTLGKCFKVKLSGENKRQLLVPKGFAHGFVTLSQWALVSYNVDALYNKEAEVTVRYDDSTLDIDWEVNMQEIILSEKDEKGMAWQDIPLFENI